jgi:hypothetical protein
MMHRIAFLNARRVANAAPLRQTRRPMSSMPPPDEFSASVRKVLPEDWQVIERLILTQVNHL